MSFLHWFNSRDNELRFEVERLRKQTSEDARRIADFDRQTGELHNQLVILKSEIESYKKLATDHDELIRRCAAAEKKIQTITEDYKIKCDEYEELSVRHEFIKSEEAHQDFLKRIKFLEQNLNSYKNIVKELKSKRNAGDTEDISSEPFGDFNTLHDLFESDVSISIVSADNKEIDKKATRRKKSE